MTKKVVNLKYAKTSDYGNVLKIIDSTNKCPFCKENFKYHKKPIIRREKKWFITENTWPYKNSQYHFIIIAEKHKEEFSELTQSDFETVSKLANWAVKKYKIKGGGLTMRFGDSDYTGATVNHLHFHLIVPKFNNKKKKVDPVYFPIG